MENDVTSDDGASQPKLTPGQRRIWGVGNPTKALAPDPLVLFGTRELSVPQDAKENGDFRHLFKSLYLQESMWSRYTLEHLFKNKSIFEGDLVECSVHAYCKWTGLISVENDRVGIRSDPIDWPERLHSRVESKFHNSPEAFVKFVVEALCPSVSRDMEKEDCWFRVFVKPQDYERLVLLSYLRKEHFHEVLRAASAILGGTKEKRYIETAGDEHSVRSALNEIGLGNMEIRRVELRKDELLEFC